MEKQTKTRVWEDSSERPETSNKKGIQEFFLRDVLQSYSSLWGAATALFIARDNHDKATEARVKMIPSHNMWYLIGRADISPEMNFLDNQFDKRLESFSPCYSQSLLPTDFYRNPHSTLVFKYIQKTWNKKPRDYSWKHFVGQKNENRKPDTNSSLRRLEWTPRNFN